MDALNSGVPPVAGGSLRCRRGTPEKPDDRTARRMTTARPWAPRMIKAGLKPIAHDAGVGLDEGLAIGQNPHTG